MDLTVSDEIFITLIDFPIQAFSFITLLHRLPHQPLPLLLNLSFLLSYFFIPVLFSISRSAKLEINMYFSGLYLTLSQLLIKY